MSTAKLLEHFNEIDKNNRGELRFDDFSNLFQKLLVTQNVTIEFFLVAKFVISAYHTFLVFTDHSGVLQLF